MNIVVVNGKWVVNTTIAELKAAKWEADCNPQTYHMGIDYNGDLAVMADDMDDVYYGTRAVIDGHTITIIDDINGIVCHCDNNDCTIQITDGDIRDLDWDKITEGEMQWMDDDKRDYCVKAKAIEKWLAEAYANDVDIVRVDGRFDNVYTLYFCHACDADFVAQTRKGVILDDGLKSLTNAMIGNGFDKFYCHINIDGLTHTGYGLDCDYPWRWGQPCDPKVCDTITRDEI